VAAVWAAAHGVRIAVHRGYGIPAWVTRDDLLVFSSYSGNTEETLSAFDAAAEHGARRRCIATGGALAARAHAAGAPCLGMPAGLQPRAALGHSLVALLTQLHHAGTVPDPVPDLDRAAAWLRRLAPRYAPEQHADNPAKQLADRWHGTLPVVYTGPTLGPAAGTRWRGQINENAKSLALVSVLPELDHNEIMGWSALPALRAQVSLCFLRDAEDGPAVERRHDATMRILAGRAKSLDTVTVEGETRLERLLGTIWLGDWASVYLAFRNGVDPTPVDEISELKRQLAAHQPA
jgi:glucose/mannose-6-phosphate isomerase